MASRIKVVDHPLVRHKVGLLRSRDTAAAEFRQIARETATLLAYEVTRDLPMEQRPIETPLEPTRVERIDRHGVCLVSILRAGNGLLDGMLDVMPFAAVGHIGIYRDQETHRPVEYLCSVPRELESRLAIVVDPMLATGNSAIAAIGRLKAHGAGRIRFVCLVAAPEGAAALADHHPDVEIFAAALDRGLDENAYIVPGLGDAGDRLYGTG